QICRADALQNGRSCQINKKLLPLRFCTNSAKTYNVTLNLKNYKNKLIFILNWGVTTTPPNGCFVLCAISFI
ncbi:hypothetical protein, partial [Campylobacter concisus]|uniref:hypothetical protein n=1 Tax=Campylobacter concisus TaxID=199 RepID=UPI001CA36CAD